MYSVISDGEDGRSRTPSPSDHNREPFNSGIIENVARFVTLNDLIQSKLQSGLDTNTCHSPWVSKIPLVESKKIQLTKNTCPIRQLVFCSVESSFWCSNSELEKLIHLEIV